MDHFVNILLNNQFLAAMIVLPLVAAINIYLGFAIADFNDSFDKVRFLLGIKKGLAVYVAIGVLQMVAQIFIVAEIDLVPTIQLIVYIVAVSYILQVIDKIKTILNFKRAEEVVRPEVTE